MAKRKGSIGKTILVIAFFLVSAAAIVYTAYVVTDATMKGQTLGSPKIDTEKLYIGVPYHQEGDPVYLILTAKNSAGKTETKSFDSTDSTYFKKLDGKDQTVVFFDYAKNPLITFGDGKTVADWIKADGDSLSAQTSCKASTITSQPVPIDKQGIWIVNCAEKDGEIPYKFDSEKSHSYIYITTVYGR